MTPYALRYLSVLSYANGITFWSYQHKGPLAEIGDPAAFFAPAVDLLDAGSRIFLSATDGAMDLHVLRVEPLTVLVMIMKVVA